MVDRAVILVTEAVMFPATRWVVAAAMLLLVFCGFRYPGFDRQNFGGPAIWVAFGIVDLLNSGTDAGNWSGWRKRTFGYALLALGLFCVTSTLAVGVTEANEVAINLLSIVASILLFQTIRSSRRLTRLQRIANDQNGCIK